MLQKLISLCLTGFFTLVPIATRADNVPKKGELTVDAGIGVGMVGYKESKTLFTQRIGAEWVIVPKFMNDDFTLAAGVYINNGYGAGFYTKAAGTYDYEYSIKVVSKRTGISYNRQHRSGFGTADVNIKREDINLLPTISLRYHVNSSLDAYLSIGIGVGMMHSIMGKKSNIHGFDKQNYHHTDNIGTTRSYSYNDLDHVDWGNSSFTKFTPALGTYIGARYTITESWGINAQVGLISANLKKSYGHSYNLFSFGASYKF